MGNYMVTHFRYKDVLVHGFLIWFRSAWAADRCTPIGVDQKMITVNTVITIASQASPGDIGQRGFES